MVLDCSLVIMRYHFGLQLIEVVIYVFRVVSKYNAANHASRALSRARTAIIRNIKVVKKVDKIPVFTINI